MITTPLTKLLNIRVPVICAPMAGAAGGKLAAAVTAAGGFGFISAGTQPISMLESEINLARTALSLTHTAPLSFGIGLMLFKVESFAGNASLLEPFLQAIVGAKPKAIWLAFGQDLKGAVDRIREIEASAQEEERRRNIIFVMVQSLKQAIEAAKWNVDVIAAQGTESGGHGPTNSFGLPLISLLPLIHSHFATLTTPPLLVAAGGITTGSQLLSILPFASGGVIGTGFLCTPECQYSDEQKALLIKSEGVDTIRTERFDVARGSLKGWGEGVDGRGLQNLTSIEDGREEGILVEDYKEGVKQGDVKRIVTWAGTSVGQLKSTATAEEIILKIEEECTEGIKALGRLIV